MFFAPGPPRIVVPIMVWNENIGTPSSLPQTMITVGATSRNGEHGNTLAPAALRIVLEWEERALVQSLPMENAGLASRLQLWVERAEQLHYDQYVLLPPLLEKQVRGNALRVVLSKIVEPHRHLARLAKEHESLKRKIKTWRIRAHVAVHNIYYNALIPLHKAVQKNDMVSVTTLVEGGAVDVIMRDREGQTAMHVACKYTDNAQLAAYLLDAPNGKKLLNACNRYNQTPLIVAASCNHPHILTELIERGADLSIINEHGLDALSIAKQDTGHVNGVLVEALESALSRKLLL